MNKLAIIPCLLLIAAVLPAQGNGATLLAKVDQYSAYNDVWGYTDPANGNEYALVGTTNGTAVYNCTDPSNPYRTGFIPGNSSTWRDIKTWGTYAYTVNESGGGLQIIDLSNPEQPSEVKKWTGAFSSSHNIYIDLGTGFAWFPGSSNNMPVVDLSNPTNPTVVANYSNRYVHDMFVQDGMAHLGELYDGTYRIVDANSMPNFPTLDTVGTPGNFTHNVWVNAANTVAVTTDEVGGAPLGIYDISNPSDIRSLSTFTVKGNSIAHNATILGDKAYVSWYGEGLVVVDLSDPSNPSLHAQYDTSSYSGTSYNGAWGVYPFSPSGVVYITDIEEGFHIIRIDGPPVQITHTPLGDTKNQTGPYIVSAQIVPSSGNSIASASVVYSVDGGSSQSLPMTNSSGDTWQAGIPGQTSPATVSYHISATDAQGAQGRHPNSGEHSFIVGDVNRIYSNDFEGGSDEGWVHAWTGNSSNDQDDWQRGGPSGQSGGSGGSSWNDPNMAASGSMCWANDLGGSGWNGAYQSNVDNYLESPVIDCTGATGVKLRFNRWLSVENGNADQTQISVNGNVVWTNSSSGNTLDSSWTAQEIDISQWADNNPSVKVRFSLTSNGNGNFGGWGMDDFELLTISGSNIDSILLTGDTTGTVGSTVSYAIASAPPSAKWWLLWSPNLNGFTMLGQPFDLGQPISILFKGLADASGMASTTSPPIPSGAAGKTVYLEAAAYDGGNLYDSNPLILVVQ